jgi:hypothetical protein
LNTSDPIISSRDSKDSSKDELAISTRFAELPHPEDEYRGGNEDADDGLTSAARFETNGRFVFKKCRFKTVF